MSAGASAPAIWEDMLNRPLSLLAGAIVFEVSWAVLLKLSDGLTRPWPSAATAVAYVLSLSCLNGVCLGLDVSVAYAVWTGCGTSLVALIGVVVFGEPFGLARAVGLSLVLAGVIVLLALGDVG